MLFVLSLLPLRWPRWVAHMEQLVPSCLVQLILRLRMWPHEMPSYGPCGHLPAGTQVPAIRQAGQGHPYASVSQSRGSGGLSFVPTKSSQLLHYWSPPDSGWGHSFQIVRREEKHASYPGGNKPISTTLCECVWVCVSVWVCECECVSVSVWVCVCVSVRVRVWECECECECEWVRVRVRVSVSVCVLFINK